MGNPLLEVLDGGILLILLKISSAVNLQIVDVTGKGEEFLISDLGLLIS